MKRTALLTVLAGGLAVPGLALAQYAQPLPPQYYQPAPQPYAQPAQQQYYQPAPQQPYAQPVQQPYGAPQYAPPAPAASGNPLSSIFACQAEGQKQTTGAVLGGLLGGVVGNKVADKENALGTVLGAALGAAAGSYIGCKMQTTDQQRAQVAAQTALDRNAAQTWTNPQTGASGNVRLVSTQNYTPPPQPVNLSGLRFAPGVQPVGAYIGTGGQVYSSGTVNVRGEPSSSGQILGKLAPNQRVDALARVQNSDWILVGANGQAIGYVAATVVQQVGAPAAVTRLCRTFDQTITTPGGPPTTERYTACQGQDGAWVVQG